MFVVAGESLIDLVAHEPDNYGHIVMGVHAGGSPYNCAIALAKLGQSVGYLCPISSDSFGDVLVAPLEQAGVVKLIAARSSKNTTLAVVTKTANGLPSYAFYREGTAERDLNLEVLISALPKAIDVFQIGGFLPIEADDFAVWKEVVAEAIARGAIISIDPNVRPLLISDVIGYKQRLSHFLGLAQIVKVSDEDLAFLDADLGIEEHAHKLLEADSVAVVIVTQGDAGAAAYTRHGKVHVDVHRPDVMGDTVGAGDSLMAGVLARMAERSLLSREVLMNMKTDDLQDILRFGVVTAGLNCAHIGCVPPERVAVERAISGLE